MPFLSEAFIVIQIGSQMFVKGHSRSTLKETGFAGKNIRTGLNSRVLCSNKLAHTHTHTHIGTMISKL